MSSGVYMPVFPLSLYLGVELLGHGVCAPPAASFPCTLVVVAENPAQSLAHPSGY